MNFIAIDVETANTDIASICQIGIAKYAEGHLVDEWVSLVDPEDYFHFINVSIHGITDEDVDGCPTFPEVINVLSRFLNNSICVCHTHFDRVSIERATLKYGLNNFNSVWLDSARVARRTWEDVAHKGYGLANLAEMLGIDFRHHDALEDAKAAGQILIAAINKSEMNLEDWLTRVNQPIDLSYSDPIRRTGNPSGPLYGEIMVFTGALEITRREAADIAADLGCEVKSGVTKTTTLLVVGDQDAHKLAGHELSSKHRKALGLMQKGQAIRVLRESDFKALKYYAAD